MATNMYGFTASTSVLILYAMGLVTPASGQQSMDYCSKIEIEAVKKECHDVYGGGHHGSLETICENVECYLQCLKDAIGDCGDRHLLFKEDIKVYKALFRARCVNATLTQLAEELCEVQVPCINGIVNKDQVKRHTMANDFQTKQLECRFSSKLVSCITVTPNNTCTPEMARLKENVEIVKHSLSQCHIAQDHPLFNKYGGEIACTNSKIKSSCFTASVMSRVSACKPITLTSFINQDKSKIKETCNDVECISQCYSTAIGECYQKEQFVMLDPQMIKISARATCDNIDVLASTIHQCRMADTTCLQALAKSLTTAHMLIQGQKYTDYKDLVCRATSKFRSCTAFDATGNCTETMAALAKNLYDVWHSYSACGTPDNASFKKYSGKLQCESCASLQTLSVLNILLLSVMYLMSMS